MTPDEQKSLRAAVFRNTGRDPQWIGHWVVRHIEAERLGPEELAGRLGISPEQLTLLCLCRTPRADHFREDALAACVRAGAPVEDVVRIIRQEQAALRWDGGAAPGPAGWLMAASDQEAPGEAGGGDDHDEPR